MRILFITSTRIGDAVLSTSILSKLLEDHPQARVTIAAGGVSVELFEGLPQLERLIVIQKRAFAGHWLKLWSQVGFKKWGWQKWDIVVDLRRSAMGKILRADKVYIAPKTSGTQHKVADFAAMMGQPLKHLTLWPTEAAKQRASDLMPKSGTVLALGAAANWAGKQWPPDRFAQLVEELYDDYEHFAVFAAAHERPLVQGLLDIIPAEKRLDLVGKTDLQTAFCCLQKCTAFVGNDTGIMHLACAAQIPVLGLFGPTDETVYGPYAPVAATVRTDASIAQICARPDYDIHGNTLSYMDTLSVEKVHKAFKTLGAQSSEQSNKLAHKTAPETNKKTA